MNTLKTFIKQYLWLIAIIGLAIIAISIFSFNGYLEKKNFDKTVSTQTNQANSAVRESRNESGVAANYSIERRAEDAVREKVITPKLDKARRRSANSQSKLETSQKQFENAKANIENLNRSTTVGVPIIKLDSKATFDLNSLRYRFNGLPDRTF